MAALTKEFLHEELEKIHAKVESVLYEKLENLAKRPDTTKRVAIIVASVIIGWDLVKYFLFKGIF